ncbi:MAG: ATP-binding protein [Methanospirillum sp.]
MTEREEPALLIDFGTNSEIALWDGQALSVTSAAGGPAFEGSGMRCGLPAVPGAICRVEFRNRAVECTTIGGAPARGLCGTGLVDLIAHLLRTGILSERGRLSGGHDKGYILPDGDPPLVLTGKDVDLFQRAKAAVGSGVQVLMERAGISGDELGHVYVCGTFGYGLDTGNAREIGLLPMVPEDRISLCGNTALAGCEELLLDPEADGRLEAIRRSAELVNLARLPDFDEFFLANLYLSPLGGA